MVPLRPEGSEPTPISGIQLYLPVFRTPTPRVQQRERELLGVVFASVRIDQLVEQYWADFPPLFGARFIVANSEVRDAVAVDTGDLFVATRRPPKPYLEKEVAIRIYLSRLWAQLWTTPAFHAHSQRYWPWAAAAGGGGFTLLTATIVLLQIRARRVQEQINAALLITGERLRSAQRGREQLSRDLHDGAIQSLYAVQLGLNRTAELTRQSLPEAGLKLDETRTTLDGVISELRSFLLHTDSQLPQDQASDFCAVLRALAKRVPSSAEVQVCVDCDAKAAQLLDAGVAVHLANIAREGISNSLRHGSPRSIAIRFFEMAGRSEERRVGKECRSRWVPDH